MDTLKNGVGAWVTGVKSHPEFEDTGSLDDFLRAVHWLRMDIPKEYRAAATFTVASYDDEPHLEARYERPATEAEIAEASRSEESLAAYWRNRDMKELARLRVMYEVQPESPHDLTCSSNG